MGKLVSVIISILTSLALLATVVTTILIWSLNKSTIYERNSPLTNNSTLSPKITN